MPFNNKRVVSIISEQCFEIENRCDGYQSEILDAVSDILQYEHQHRVSRTTVQQQINDKCNAAARFLVEKRNEGNEA